MWGRVCNNNLKGEDEIIMRGSVVVVVVGADGAVKSEINQPK